MHNLRRFLLPLAVAAFCLHPAKAQFFEHKEHHLGPTGLFGVTSPKDIKISKVTEGSPADGKIKVGDVITGAGGTTFKDRTRQQLADAIDAAETEAAKGVLTLTLEGGKTIDLQLKMLGSYSDHAPFKCKKTDAIITQTADYLVKSRKFGRGDMNIGLLGLLATGEQKYIDVVKEAIHAAAWARPDLEFSIANTGRTAWSWGYTNLLLAEYYLLTGDKYVLPALKAYSVALATGRDAAGLWGHGMASFDNNRGQKHGRLSGYAVMNQSSLPCFISLVLADKAGIRHPEVQAAIAQTHTFYADFIGRGTLPYGVHDPNTKAYNNNGMSGLAAVALSLSGNKKGAAFFSRMSAAAHNTMETGHTGHFFNQMWTGPGANLAGPVTTAAFFKQTRWLHTLNRTWDGSFTYDCCGYREGIYSYRGLSDAGSHLLNYCLGRHKLFITGRDADESIWIKGGDVEETIALDSIDFAASKDEEILAMFGHTMPKVRLNAVWTLRPRKHDLTGRIKGMIVKGTKLERNSAISYFGYGCPKEVVMEAKDEITAVLRDPKESMELRSAAAYSLAWLAQDGYPYFGDILKLVVADKPGDPLGRFDVELGKSLNTLCLDPYAAGLVTDKKLFYAAAIKLLKHRRAYGRTSGAKLIANIPLEDFHYVGDQVAYIVADQDLGYHSYHNLDPITNSVAVMAKHRIKGGIEGAFAIYEAPTGKFGFKARMIMDVLSKYGSAAKPALEKLRADPMFKNIEAGRFGGNWRAMVKAIEEDDSPADMISLEEAKKAGAIK